MCVCVFLGNIWNLINERGLCLVGGRERGRYKYIDVMKNDAFCLLDGEYIVAGAIDDGLLGKILTVNWIIGLRFRVVPYSSRCRGGGSDSEDSGGRELWGTLLICQLRPFRHQYFDLME